MDFSYSFAPPHRITLCVPSGSMKTVVDVDKDNIMLMWSYRSLLEAPYNVWQAPSIDWLVSLKLFIDGNQAKFTSWKRASGGIPAFIVESNYGGVKATLFGIGSADGDIVRMKAVGTDGKQHTAALIAEHKNGWIISNPAWVDGSYPNVLTCMQQEVADKLLVCAFGADEFIAPEPGVQMAKSVSDASRVPMGDMGSFEGFYPAKSLVALCRVEDTEKTVYLFRPYKKYIADMPELTDTDWGKATESAVQLWENYIMQGCRPIIPDKSMSDAFFACFSDMSVMREKLCNGDYSCTPGTQVYRSANDAEGVLADTIFMRMGFTEQAVQDLPVHLGGQGDDGDWNNPHGWSMKIWLIAGFKARLAVNYYKISGDKDFLGNVYKTMKRNSDWQQLMRLSTLNDPNPSCRGLMPRGMGDCGLMNGNDYFGVFYPHNCMALYSDYLTLYAAVQLGYKEDAAELEKWYNEAKAALLSSIRAEAIKEDGYVRISACPASKAGTSQYGSLMPYLTDIMEFDDPIIQGTLGYLEQNISPGGLPVDLGWLKGGLWVAIALDNISAAWLKSGNGDEAAKYLYPTVEHASPFVTWCEERGAEAGSTLKSGDMQHLWTPAAVCIYMLDALCYDSQNGLRLCAGTPREWLQTGLTVGITDICVPGGKLSYTLYRKSDNCLIFSYSSKEYKEIGKFSLEVRVPEKQLNIVSVNCEGCLAVINGRNLEITPQSESCNITIAL